MEKIKAKLKKLPDEPGVYLFYNSDGEMIYAGKASSLRSRVRSYFKDSRLRGNDSAGFRPIEEMMHEVADIRAKETGSAFEAAILEGEYIKKFKPRYNVLWRDDKSWNYFYLTKENFPRLRVVREHDLKRDSSASVGMTKRVRDLVGADSRLRGNDMSRGGLFGPYPNLNTREAMKILRRLFFVSNCEENAKKPCFDYQIGRCLGVCTGEISVEEYAEKVIGPLKLFLRGNKKRLLSTIKKEMASASKKENFEEATRLRDQLMALGKIQDAAILNKSFVVDIFPVILSVAKNPRNGRGSFTSFRMTGGKELRIEGYDISNLGASDKVGSMVVFDEAGPVKNNYRKFNIKTVSGQSDVDCLAEVLSRRLNHDEWPLPDVFMVDGGLPQVNRALAVLKLRGINIPVVGIAKGHDRKKNEFFLAVNGGKILGATPGEWLKNNKMLLIQTRDEAHRFAIAFNRQKRKILR